MSRLIVKNLPVRVDPNDLKKKFSEKGDVTDVQLRYTPQGKFRKFAFVGFKTEEQASEALKYFDNTFFNSSRMKVELCHNLGSTDKPRPWSKHTQIQEAIPTTDVKTSKKSKSSNKSKQLDPELVQKIGKHKDEPEFREFMEVHAADKVLGLAEKNDSGVEEDPDSDSETDTKPTVSAAHAPISDADYLKLKTKGTEPVQIPLTEDTPPHKFDNFFTVKIKNLPKSVKKQDIKELFKPSIPKSVRKARGLLGVAYVGFATEKEMKRALVKNKSFVKGKQVSVTVCEERNKNVKGSDVGVTNKWKKQEDSLVGEDNVGESGRIFIRNLCYSVTEEEVEQLFSKYGPLSETDLPLDRLTRKMKGYGTVTFLFPEHAVAAYTALDGTVFQGRMLHLLPAKLKQELSTPESSNYKQKKQAHLKKTAGLSHNWNSLFLGRNAIADVIADTYKASKKDVLTGSEAAVRLALGETQLVANTRQFLTDQGICLDAFNSSTSGTVPRSKTVILVKNLPANTTEVELKEKFEKFGVLGRLVLPPSGVTAVVEFLEPSEARTAFTKLAYTKFKNLPLYLEWAPQNTFRDHVEKTEEGAETIKEEEEEEKNTDEDEEEEMQPEPDTTLYIKNLNFNTTEDNLRQLFTSCGKVADVTISRKRDPKSPGKLLSLGYGFVQFYLRSSVVKALAELQGSELDGHSLEIKRSDRTSHTEAVAPRKSANTTKQTGSKILVRNVPFQADPVEIRKLFATFGLIKSVRMPKKLVGSGRHRGFCFVEFTTKHDAKSAMKALCHSTHLYGRRLVLEWAAPDELEVENLRKKTAQHFLAGSESTDKRSNKAVADMDMDQGEEDDDIV